MGSGLTTKPQSGHGFSHEGGFSGCHSNMLIVDKHVRSRLASGVLPYGSGIPFCGYHVILEVLVCYHAQYMEHILSLLSLLPTVSI